MDLKKSEACDWDSHEHCSGHREKPTQVCFCTCHPIIFCTCHPVISTEGGGKTEEEYQYERGEI